MIGSSKFLWRLAVTMSLAALLAGPVLAVNKDFDGPVGGDWNTGVNWNPDGVPGPGDNVFVFVYGGATKTITLAGTPAPDTVNELVLAREGNGTATVNQTGGTLNVNSWFNLGQGFGAAPNNGTGIWNMSGSSILNVTHSAGGQTVIGAGFTAAPNKNNGILSIADNAQFLQSTAEIRVAGETNARNADGTIAVSGSGILNNLNGDLNVGYGAAGSVGTLTLADSGQVTANIIRIGVNSTGNATQTGGTMNTRSWFVVSQNANVTGSYTLNGGTLNVNTAGGGNVQVGVQANGTGTMNLGNSAAVDVQNGAGFWIGSDVATAQGIVNQSGASTVSVSGDMLVGRYGIGSYDLGGSASIQLTPGGKRFVVGDAAGSSGSFTQGGTSTVTLGTSGGNINWASVGGSGSGVYTLDGGSLTAYTASGFNVADWGRGVMNVNGGSLRVRDLFVGKLGSAAGAVNQAGGNVTVNIDVTGGGENRLGGNVAAAANAYGSYVLEGGSLNIGQNLQIGAYGQGVFTQTGGTFDSRGWHVVGRYAGSVGVQSVFGGTFNQTSGSQNIILGELGAGTLNVGGTGTVDSAGGVRVAIGGTGTLNLLTGGTLAAPVVFDGGGNALVNFNGGTLRAKANRGDFLQGLDAAYVHAEGASVDTNGFDVTVAQPLLAPGGSGVVTIPVADGGSGYLGAPIVQISGGGGSGASAVANMVSDGAGGLKVDSITITNPGVNYASAPAITLLGGGAATAATVGTAGLGTNVSGGLTKLGAGTLTLTGANTFRGDTRIGAGTLTVSNANALQFSTVDMNAADSGLLAFTQASTLGGLKGSRDVNYGGNALSVGNNDTDQTYSGALIGTTSLAKVGTGRWTLTGSSTLGSPLYVRFGTLDVATGGSLTVNSYASVGQVSGENGTLVASGTGVIDVNGDFNSSDVGSSRGAVIVKDSATVSGWLTWIGKGTDTTGTLAVSDSGTFNARRLYVGAYGNSVGAITQTGGQILRDATGTVEDWRIGGAGGGDANAYGYLGLSGGMFDTGVANFQIGAYGRGVLTQTGGTLNSGQWPVIGRNAGSVGVVTVNGGSFHQTGAGNRLIIGENGLGVLNVGGTGTVDVTGGLWTGLAGGTGIVNLATGGTIATPWVAVNGGTGTVNFHGGTLKAKVDNAGFFQGLTAAYVWSEGAVIDTDGRNVTIAQPLLAPAGQGLTSIALTGNGTGYVGEPIVQISGGGGGGATARAVFDRATGTVTGIQITNPGVGYTSAPTVTLVGGGPTAAAAIGAVSLGDNVSGGLTKAGAGNLTLTAANTFRGDTRIGAGTLTVSNANALQYSTLDMNAADSGALALTTPVTLGGLKGSRALDYGRYTLSVGNNNTDQTYSGALAGSDALMKVGAGQWTLSGNNAYSGQTSVLGGTLIAASNTALGSTAAGTVVGLGSATNPVNRYSFSETGGAGTTLVDSVSGRNASIVDGGASDGTVGNGQVTLAGGAKASADYVQFPNGMLNPYADATIEIWATPHSVQNWSRIFDFGNDTNNNLLMAWTQGTNVNTDRAAFKVGGVENYVDNTMTPYVLNQQAHIVMTIDDDGGPAGQTQIRVFKNGSYRGTLNTNYNLSQLIENNNFLGRSQYGDNTANASWNELRIYSAELSDAQIAANYNAGPDALAAATTATLALDGQPNGDLNIVGESLTLAGEGTGGQGALLNLRGNNTFDGPITLAADARINSAAGTLTLPQGVGGANRNLAVGGAGDVVIAGPVAIGAGGLAKDGDGTLVLSGNSIYTGATAVSGGKLRVDGSIASPVTVTGGMLGGNGAITGDVNVQGGGAISAGQSPGHLLILSGDYTQTAGAQTSTLLAELGGTSQGADYDWIEVADGTASLTGTVKVELVDSFYPQIGDTFDILTAGSGFLTDLSAVTFDFSGAALSVPATFWKTELVGLGGDLEALRLSIGVPEPSTFALFGLGLLGLWGCFRRRS